MKHNLQIGLIVGLILPKAGGGKLQTWWHNLINYNQPEGWEYQTIFTWKVTMHRLSPEVAGDGNHNYGSLEMAVRF